MNRHGHASLLAVLCVLLGLTLQADGVSPFTEVLFVDQFDEGILDTEWRWIDPGDDSSLSFSRYGWLEIVTTSRNDLQPRANLDDEADFFAEVFIGRIPADNATEALNHINKIIAYESSIHTKNVLLVGRKLDDDPTWGGTCKDLVYAYFPASWTATTLYERDGTYSQTALIDEMNSDAHHIVNYLSHSGSSNDMGLSSSQIAGLREIFPRLQPGM